MTLSHEHYLLFNAISMWQRTLQLLCDKNYIDSISYDYSYFVSNANTVANVNHDLHVKQVILDFYDYFYTKEHICDINTIHSSLGKFDNNYGLGEHKIDILDMIKDIPTVPNKNSISVFSEITIYTFILCLQYRTVLNLNVYEGKKDEYLSKYFTRI